MDYEKLYKEAIERAKQWEGNQSCVDYIFPELKERDDEKWRKWLIGHLSGYINQTDDKYAEVCKKAIAWLEKQGEQKPTWSEDDEIGWTNTMIMIKEVASNHYTKDSVKLVIDWLKSIKDRVQPQPRQWSKEDEQYFLVCKNALAKYQTTNKWDASIISQWLENRLKCSSQVTQAWSEEDEKRIDRICEFVWKNRKGDTDEIYQQEQDVNWLKSLKDRLKGEYR